MREPPMRRIETGVCPPRATAGPPSHVGGVALSPGTSHAGSPPVGGDPGRRSSTRTPICPRRCAFSVPSRPADGFPEDAMTTPMYLLNLGLLAFVLWANLGT